MHHWLYDSWRNFSTFNMLKGKELNPVNEVPENQVSCNKDKLGRRKVQKTFRLKRLVLRRTKLTKSMNAQEERILAGSATPSNVKPFTPLTQNTKSHCSSYFNIRSCIKSLNPLSRFFANSSSASSRKTFVKLHHIVKQNPTKAPVNIQINHSTEIIKMDVDDDDIKDESREIIFENPQPYRPTRGIRKDIGNNGTSLKCINEELDKPFYTSRGKENEIPRRQKPIILEEKPYFGKFCLKTYVNRSKDPAGYFLDKKRECSFNPTSLEFLFNYFFKISKEIVRREYRSNQYNMSIAAVNLIELENCSYKKITRNCRAIEAEEIYQLQEMQFIHNMAEGYRKNSEKNDRNL